MANESHKTGNRIPPKGHFRKMSGSQPSRPKPKTHRLGDLACSPGTHSTGGQGTLALAKGFQSVLSNTSRPWARHSAQLESEPPNRHGTGRFSYSREHHLGLVEMVRKSLGSAMPPVKMVRFQQSEAASDSATPR